MKSKILMIVMAFTIVLCLSSNTFAKGDWEETLKKAREEGKLSVIGGSSLRAIKKHTKLFKDKFGIEMVCISGRASELIRKVEEERKSGLYLHDVFLTGGEDLIVQVKPKGFLEPLEPALMLPEVVDPKLWYGGKLGWLDKDRYVLAYASFPAPMVAINTKLVKPGEIKSYQDLLDPKWKEKIAISDPSLSGLANVGFTNMLYHKLVSIDFLKKIAAQGNPVLKDQNLQAEWGAKGKYPILLWPSPARLSRYTKQGAPVALVHDIKEGTVVASSGCCVGLFNKAPNPNAAKIFINWFLSKEGLDIVQKETNRQMGRLDMSSAELPDDRKKLPGGKYVENIIENEDFLLKEWNNYIKLGGEIFGKQN